MNFQKFKTQPKQNVSKVKEENKQNQKKSFTHASYLLITKGPYKAREGYVKQFYPGSYDIFFVLGDGSSVVRSGFKKNQFNFTKEENVVYITKGNYKTQTGKIIKHYPAHLSVEVGEKLLHNISLNDIFYKDFLLKTNNYAQVVEILEDNTILVDVINKGIRTRNTITKNDISSEGRGFSFNDTVDTDDIENNTVQMEYVSNDNVTNDNADDEEIDNLNTGEYENEVDYEIEDTKEIDGIDGIDDDENALDDSADNFLEENVYSEGFKDYERSTIMNEKPTYIQSHIKGIITKILKCINVNEESVEIYDLITNVESVVYNIEKVNSVNVKIMDTLELPYIVVCVVFNKLLNKEFFTYSFEDYVSLLIKKKVLKYNDLLIGNNAIIINLDEDEVTKTTVQNMSSKNPEKLIKVLIKSLYNYLFDKTKQTSNKRKFIDYIKLNKEMGTKKSFISSVFSEFNAKTNSGKSILNKSLGKDYSTISLYAILADLVPKKEVNIDWGICKSLLEKAYSQLNEKIQVVKTNTTSEKILKNTLDNLHRGPFFLKDTELDSKTKSYFKNTLDLLLDSCKKRFADRLQRLYPERGNGMDTLENDLNKMVESYDKEKLLNKKRLEFQKKRAYVITKRNEINRLGGLKNYNKVYSKYTPEEIEDLHYKMFKDEDETDKINVTDDIETDDIETDDIETDVIDENPKKKSKLEKLKNKTKLSRFEKIEMDMIMQDQTNANKLLEKHTNINTPAFIKEQKKRKLKIDILKRSRDANNSYIKEKKSQMDIDEEIPLEQTLGGLDINLDEIPLEEL